MLKWLNKIDLLILLAIMAVMIFAVLMLYGFNNGKFTFLNNKNQKQNLNQEIKEEEIKRTDYTDVARKTLDWIDKQRNEDGWYILERGCDYEKKTCDIVWDNKEGNKDGLIATWARLNFYEQHKDPKDLEIVKKDIDIFYEKYKNDNLKDSLWICKITYEMAQSKYIEQPQKDKLKELCINVEYPSPEEVKKYTDDIDEELVKLKGEIWDNWKGYSVALRGFNNYFGLTTEMIVKNKWQKEDKNIDLAREYWKINKNYLDDIPTEDKCLLGLSGLDLYRFGGEEKTVLNFVEVIYDKYMKESDGEKTKREYQTTMCGLMLKGLYQITDKLKYGTALEINNDILYTINNDNNENKNQMVSDGGFYKSGLGILLAPFKNITENGLIIDLIRD